MVAPSPSIARSHVALRQFKAKLAINTSSDAIDVMFFVPTLNHLICIALLDIAKLLDHIDIELYRKPAEANP